jgi:hypothetical protein
MTRVTGMHMPDIGVGRIGTKYETGDTAWLTPLAVVNSVLVKVSAAAGAVVVLTGAQWRTALRLSPDSRAVSS